MTDRTVSKECCKECSFKRDATQGYLGEASWDPLGFLAPHWDGEVPLPCHMLVKWGEKDSKVDTAPLCRGMFVMMRNACKLPVNEHMCDLLETVEPDRELFFSYSHEFVRYHEEMPDE